MSCNLQTKCALCLRLLFCFCSGAWFLHYPLLVPSSLPQQHSAKHEACLSK